MTSCRNGVSIYRGYDEPFGLPDAARAFENHLTGSLVVDDRVDKGVLDRDR